MRRENGWYPHHFSANDLIWDLWQQAEAVNGLWGGELWCMLQRQDKLRKCLHRPGLHWQGDQWFLVPCVISDPFISLNADISLARLRPRHESDDWLISDMRKSTNLLIIKNGCFNSLAFMPIIASCMYPLNHILNLPMESAFRHFLGFLDLHAFCEFLHLWWLLILTALPLAGCSLSDKSGIALTPSKSNSSSSLLLDATSVYPHLKTAAERHCGFSPSISSSSTSLAAFIWARRCFTSSSSWILASKAFLFASHSALTSCDVWHFGFVSTGWTLHPGRSGSRSQEANWALLGELSGWHAGWFSSSALVHLGGGWLATTSAGVEGFRTCLPVGASREATTFVVLLGSGIVVAFFGRPWCGHGGSDSVLFTVYEVLRFVVPASMLWLPLWALSVTPLAPWLRPPGPPFVAAEPLAWDVGITESLQVVVVAFGMDKCLCVKKQQGAMCVCFASNLKTCPSSFCQQLICPKPFLWPRLIAQHVGRSAFLVVDFLVIKIPSIPPFHSQRTQLITSIFTTDFWMVSHTSMSLLEGVYNRLS